MANPDAVNAANVEQAIVEERKTSADEARAYVAIVRTGKMDAARVAKMLSWDEQRAQNVAASLVGRGMVIAITKTEYESLHPRFAVTNRYRRRCNEDNIPFKKNLRVDNIGILLEKPYDDARTK